MLGIVVLAGGMLASGVVAIVLITRPRVDPVRPVDALYVIGPAEGRIADARRLMAEGAARTLVVTVTVDPKTDEVYTKDFCDPAPWEVICVRPDPYTTRGEAAALARLARERGWTHAAVLTQPSHVSRARMWMTRCVPIPVDLWASSEHLGLWGWVKAIAYQSAAWVKAQVQSSCA